MPKPDIVSSTEPFSKKPLETLLEVESTLRTALQQTREAISALRRQKKQAKLMQATLAGLKQLQFAA